MDKEELNNEVSEDDDDMHWETSPAARDALSDSYKK